MVVGQIQPTQAAAVAQAQAQAALLAANGNGASATGNQQRNVTANGVNPFWNVGGAGGMPPAMLAGGFPGNFYPQMAAFHAAQENATAMVAVAKISKGYGSAASKLVVRNSVRKFNISGGIFSVAQWTRKTLEENLEWLASLSQKHAGDSQCLLLAYGDGCETLVLLDGHIDKAPEDIKKVKKIGIGASMAKLNVTLDEKELANLGVLHPTDSMWEHLRFETISKKENVEKCLYIHTFVTLHGDSMEGRRRVLQVATGKNLAFKPNPPFEQQILSQWSGQGSGVAVVPAGPVEKETWVTFNPKELLLLEKAFDNRLTSRDLKTKVEKFTQDDKIAAQYVIKRANDEFVYRFPRKRRKKDPAVEEETKKEPQAKAPADKKEEKAKTPAKPSTPKKATKKTPVSEKKNKKAVKKEENKKKVVKKEEDDDDDDEPISKMVKKTPPKKSPRKTARNNSSASADSKKMSKSTKKAAETKPKTPAKKNETTRGRQAKETPSKQRSRSKSRGKK